MLLSHEGIEVILKWTDESAKKSAKQRNTKITLFFGSPPSVVQKFVLAFVVGLHVARRDVATVVTS